MLKPGLQLLGWWWWLYRSMVAMNLQMTFWLLMLKLMMISLMFAVNLLVLMMSQFHHVVTLELLTRSLSWWTPPLSPGQQSCCEGESMSLCMLSTPVLLLPQSGMKRTWIMRTALQLTTVCVCLWLCWPEQCAGHRLTGPVSTEVSVGNLRAVWGGPAGFTHAHTHLPLSPSMLTISTVYVLLVAPCNGTRDI